MICAWYLACCDLGRMIAVLIIVGLSAVGLGIGLIAAATAPAGYQDETGFHYGQLDGVREEEGVPCVVPRVTPQPKLA